MKGLAYLLGTFPALTETFVLGEIQALREAGVTVELFALRPPQTSHDRSHGADLAAETYYSPALDSREMWAANLAALRRAPGRYLGTLASVVARTALNPVHCAKTIGIFAAAAAFAERMRERSVRHIHAHWANYPATAAYIASRLLDIPFSITAHVYDATLIRSLMREKIRRAAFVVTCNRFNGDRLGGLVPEARSKIIINYHGAALERFEPAPRPAPEDDVVELLSCGSLYPRKGFPVLIEACRLLRDRGHRFRCTIVGEGPLRPRLEQLIERHGLGDLVRLVGALPHREVIAAYRRADLFTLACVTDHLGWDELFSEPVLLLEVGPAIPFRSLTDGIPNVLVEAMAMELPVVSTTVAGVPELVADGANGLLVPEQDPEALAEALASLIKDPGRRRAFGLRGRATVTERFDRARNIQELVRVFTRLAPTPTTRPLAELACDPS
jgi:glycosyltransferase involved in cell wall biosynthesis